MVITKKASKTTKKESKKTAGKAVKKAAPEKPVVAKKMGPKPKVSLVEAGERTQKPIKKIAEAPSKARRYFEAVGRRKTATCRARLFTARPLEEYEGRIIVNDKPYKEYFPTFELQQVVEASLNKLKSLNRFEISAKVWGGGIRAQAEAVRHGIARTLVLFNPDFRKKLKRANYLRRDPRMKERKKYGLKKARRAPQWSKR